LLFGNLFPPTTRLYRTEKSVMYSCFPTVADPIPVCTHLSKKTLPPSVIYPSLSESQKNGVKAIDSFLQTAVSTHPYCKTFPRRSSLAYYLRPVLFPRTFSLIRRKTRRVTSPHTPLVQKPSLFTAVLSTIYAPFLHTVRSTRFRSFTPYCFYSYLLPSFHLCFFRPYAEHQWQTRHSFRRVHSVARHLAHVFQQLCAVHVGILAESN
jgi:hypothetical protein